MVDWLEFKERLEVKLVYRIFKVIERKVGIDHCGFDISVAKQFAYCNQWHTRHYQMTGKCMPEGMNGYAI